MVYSEKIGRFFNSTRWVTLSPTQHLFDAKELDQAERFNNAPGSTPTLQLPNIGGEGREVDPPTPAATDDEDEGLTMPEVDKVALRRTQAQLEQMLLEKRAPELTDRELIEAISLADCQPHRPTRIMILGNTPYGVELDVTDL